MGSQVFVHGVALNLKTCTFTRSGYKFLGWSRNSGATTPEYTDGQLVRITSGGASGTLYAVWEKI